MRLRAGLRQAQQGIERQDPNGDEQRYARRIANFSKGLPHNAFGEVQPEAYATLLKALRTGDASDFAAIPLGGTAKLANPQSAFAYQLEGAEASALALPAAPRFASLVQAGEAVELYWRALARDIPFADYVGNATIAAAVTDLRRFPGYEDVTAATLFRGSAPGEQVGPHLSQFFWLDIPYGAKLIQQLYVTNAAGIDHLTDFAAFLAVQNGGAPVSPEAFETEPRYILNGRDLAAWVHRDFTYQAFLNAALILLGYGPAALDPANPYLNGGFENQGAFCTFGGPAVIDLVSRAGIAALKAAWYQKWMVHRRLRPEVFGARIDRHLTGQRTYPLPTALLDSPALDRVHDTTGSYLLPQGYPEGSPTHPAYPAGHATIAGACATILKAFFKEDFVLPNPRVPNSNGSALIDYSGPALTLGGEVNKLAANVSFGRDFAGIHWRSDGVEGLRLGEQVALRLLQDAARLPVEPFEGFSLTTFDGETITV